MRERTVPGRHVGNKLAGIVGSTMLVGPILTGIMAQAQPPQVAESPPSFEVASIKANHSGERVLNMFHLGRGGRFTATNCSLGILIPYAYNVFQFQVSGVPGWVRSDG